jgi:hypothetical protein
MMERNRAEKFRRSRPDAENRMARLSAILCPFVSVSVGTPRNKIPTGIGVWPELERNSSASSAASAREDTLGRKMSEPEGIAGSSVFACFLSFRSLPSLNTSLSFAHGRCKGTEERRSDPRSTYIFISSSSFTRLRCFAQRCLYIYLLPLRESVFSKDESRRKQNNLL